MRKKRGKYTYNYVHPETLVGEQRHRLTCISFKEGATSREDQVLVKCTCGREKWLKKAEFLGKTKSCGCLRVEIGYERVSLDSFEKQRTKHGMCNTPTYVTWLNMKGRCLHDNDKRYQSYGGAGISFTPRWAKFENFLEDMGERPEGTTLDRIDPTGNYTKDNCRWVTPDIQAYNKKKRKGTTENASKYKGVFWYDRYGMYEAKARVLGKTVYLGRTASDELGALRYDKVMEIIGYGGCNNKGIGLLNDDLSEKYPCDFYFWNYCINNVPQKLDFVN